MKSKIYLTLLAAILTVLGAMAAVPQKEANALATAQKEYDAGNYSEALQLYKTLAGEYPASAELLYNQGNTYVKMHDLGHARKCYEQARRLEPGNDEINNNLEYVCQQIEKQNRADLHGEPVNISPDEQWFFSSIYSAFSRDTKSDTWALLAAIAFVLFILFVADYLFTKRVLYRKFGFFGAMVMLGFSVIFTVFAFSAARESQSGGEAVITAEKIILKEEPSEKSKDNSPKLNAGTKVEVVKTEGGTEEQPEWYKLRVNSDIIGWAKKDDIEMI